MARGVLTPEVQEVAKVQLGREITQGELRLMPYIQFLMMNEQKIDQQKINGEERDIWASWKKAGYADGGMTGMQISKKFWDALHEIVFIAYVKSEDGELE